MNLKNRTSKTVSVVTSKMNWVGKVVNRKLILIIDSQQWYSVSLCDKLLYLFWFSENLWRGLSYLKEKLLTIVIGKWHLCDKFGLKMILSLHLCITHYLLMYLRRFWTGKVLALVLTFASIFIASADWVKQVKEEMIQSSSLRLRLWLSRFKIFLDTPALINPKIENIITVWFLCASSKISILYNTEKSLRNLKSYCYVNSGFMLESLGTLCNIIQQAQVYLVALSFNFMWKVKLHATNSSLHSPYLSALDFCNSPVWNIQFDELDF